jgi:hypothetical protein
VAQWDELQTAKKLVNAAFRDGLEIGVINLKPDHYGAHK